MASHQLAIAKASLSAAFLRPDPTSLSRDDISSFHTLLDDALAHCSSANIQRCKSWLVSFVVSSSNRVGGLGKYLVALASSYSSANDGQPALSDGLRKPSSKRKTLHILYLLHDLLHHTKFHSHNTAAFSTMSGSLQPYVVDLLGCAASYDRQKNPKHHRRLDGLLDLWEEQGYFSSDYVNKLREVVRSSAATGAVKASVGFQSDDPDWTKKVVGKDAPYTMPPTHGDPSTPYYDLPAGNLVPHIIPNSFAPLRPDSIKPLQFLAGPADQKLAAALKSFLRDVDRIYGVEETVDCDDGIFGIDELGQTVIRDQNTDEMIDGETYYGWSREFCQKMTRRNENHARDRSETRSLSRGKRRCYSDSSGSEGMRSYESRSRSRSRSRRRGLRRRYSSVSRSRSISRRYSSSRERTYSPRPPSPTFQTDNQYPRPPPPPPLPLHQTPQPMQFPPNDGTFNPPALAPGMFSIPPRPPNYNGPWPPPPPPMPITKMAPAGFATPFVNQSGYVAPLPSVPGQPMLPQAFQIPLPHMGSHEPSQHGSWDTPRSAGHYPPPSGWH